MTRILLTLGMVLGIAMPAAAQIPAAAFGTEVHRLEIRDGVVYHDGRALPEGALPEGLDLDGITMAFDYSGEVAPAIGLNGRVFALDGGRLVELDEATAEGSAQAFALTQPRTLGRSAAEEHEERRRQAEEVYLQSLSESDRAHYLRLVREREMEDETLRLAQQYRQTPDEDARAQVRQELRDKLGAMFDLKQENRHEEVRQMETVLDTLRQRLEERELMRGRIVEHRLNELIGP